MFTTIGILYSTDKIKEKNGKTIEKSQGSDSTFKGVSYNYPAVGTHLIVQEEPELVHKFMDEQSIYSVERLMRLFSVLVMKEVSLQNENQYTVACAVISAARS